MGGGDEVRFAQAQLIELGLGDVRQAFRLVDQKEDLAARDAQALRDAGVVRRQPRARVADEEHDVGFFDRELGLTGHRLNDAFGLDGFEPPGVDDQVRARAHAALTVLTVAGEAGVVRHDGVAAAGKPVEERGLPDVRAPHKSDNRKHGAFYSVGPGRTHGARKDVGNGFGKTAKGGPTLLVGCVRLHACGLPCLRGEPPAAGLRPAAPF